MARWNPHHDRRPPSTANVRVAHIADPHEQRVPARLDGEPWKARPGKKRRAVGHLRGSHRELRVTTARGLPDTPIGRYLAENQISRLVPIAEVADDHPPKRRQRNGETIPRLAHHGACCSKIRVRPRRDGHGDDLKRSRALAARAGVRGRIVAQRTRAREDATRSTSKRHRPLMNSASPRTTCGDRHEESTRRC